MISNDALEFRRVFRLASFYNVAQRLGQGAFSNEFMAGLVYKTAKAMKKELKPD